MSGGEIDEKIWQEAFDWTVEIDRHGGDAAVERALQGWLAQSPDHAAAYHQVRTVWAAAPHLQPNFSGAVRQYPDVAFARSRAPILSRRQWLTGAGAMAASVGLFVATGGFGDLLADHATRKGETRSVTLADGSHLHLDTDTAIGVSFSDQRRAVTLRHGRAYFDVARDTARPFVVAAARTRLEAVGTRFDVRLDDDAVSVTVGDGQIEVDIDGGPVDRTLSAGDLWRFELANGAVHQASLPPERIAASMAAWRDKRLVVEGWTVAQVLDEIGRYHSGPIVLRDRALGAKRVSGFYDLTRPVEAVRAVAGVHGGRITEVGGSWLILVSGAQA